jgi:hypothetical protein
VFLAPCISKEATAGETFSSIPLSGYSSGEAVIAIGAFWADVVGTLHDKLVVAGVEFVHGHELLHVLEVHSDI